MSDTDAQELSAADRGHAADLRIRMELLAAQFPAANFTFVVPPGVLDGVAALGFVQVVHAPVQMPLVAVGLMPVPLR